MLRLIYRFTVSADLYEMLESGAQLFISFIDVGQISTMSGLTSSHFLLAKRSKCRRGPRVGKKKLGAGRRLPAPFQTLSATMDLVMVLEAILTSRQPRENLQSLYENLMSNNFRKTAVLEKDEL